MLKIISQLLDLIFPPRKTEVLLRTSKKQVEHLYAERSYEGIHYLTTYDEPLIRALIKENKYHQNTDAAKQLATLCAAWLRHCPRKPLIIVPIPQSKERRKERGYNQVECFLNKLPHIEGVTIDTKLLKKIRHTETQTSQSKEKRLLNVTGSFEVGTLDIVGGATIVIIDDVVTTGATLKAARASLAPHLPPHTDIILVALAH